MTDNLYTVPSAEEIGRRNSVTPEYMRPSTMPQAAVAVGYLSPDMCEELRDDMLRFEPYTFGSCNAVTREAALDDIPYSMMPVVGLVDKLNSLFWDFDLDSPAAAWMQTYEAGGDYHEHVDAFTGQSRKLTAVVLLSDASDYTGGHLWLLGTPKDVVVEKAQGTVVVFPSWVRHRVDKIHSGNRQTINLGYWGPDFR